MWFVEALPTNHNCHSFSILQVPYLNNLCSRTVFKEDKKYGIIVFVCGNNQIIKWFFQAFSMSFSLVFFLTEIVEMRGRKTFYRAELLKRLTCDEEELFSLCYLL